MNIEGLDHIGIAVRRLDEALTLYRDHLGLELKSIETVSEMKVRVAKLAVGSTILELIEPLAGEEATRKFLEKRGEGIHHICLRVKDLDQAVAELKTKGYQPVYDTPHRGSGGTKVNFLRPANTHGVLLELCQLVLSKAEGRVEGKTV